MVLYDSLALSGGVWQLWWGLNDLRRESPSRRRKSFRLDVEKWTKHCIFLLYHAFIRTSIIHHHPVILSRSCIFSLASTAFLMFIETASTHPLHCLPHAFIRTPCSCSQFIAHSQLRTYIHIFLFCLFSVQHDETRRHIDIISRHHIFSTYIVLFFCLHILAIIMTCTTFHSH